MNIEQYPSVNQTSAHSKTSEKYAFIPTTRVLGVLADHGWSPVSITETRTLRTSNNRGYQKHYIRLAQTNGQRDLLAVGDERAEIGIINSHNGRSSFELFLGIYRCVCSNQAVVGSQYDTYRVRHMGYTDNAIEKALKHIVYQAQTILPAIEKYKNVLLSAHETEQFARSAIELVQGEDNKFSITPRTILNPRRYDDLGNGLWQTFNRVQENVIRGGMLRHDANHRRTHTRAIKNIDRNVALNRSLWDLLETTANSVATH